MSEPRQRRTVLRFGVVAACVHVLAARADPPASAPLPAAALPIQALFEGLLAIMRAGKSTPFPQRYAMLAPTVERTFDLAEVLRVSVGSAWPSLPASQKARLAAVFKRYTVATYVANFSSFTGQRFDISPNVRSLGNAEQVVETELAPGDGETPVKLAFVMRQAGDGWKAVDVLLDGSISRVAVQRSDFRGLLADRSGEALITRLSRQVADLSGGTLS